MAHAMASGGSSARGSSSRGGWTQRQNKQFECALAVYDRETPDRWHNVARYMGGAKSAEEVRRHFEQLVADVAQIEAGHVPFPATARRPPPPQASTTQPAGRGISSSSDHGTNDGAREPTS